MFSRIRSILRSLFRWEDYALNRWELIILRLGMVWVILDGIPYVWPPGTQSHPTYTSLPAPSSVGEWWPWITRLSDVSFLMPAKYALYAACVLFAIGRLAPLAMIYAMLFSVCVDALIASQDVHGHSRQAMALVLLALALGGVIGLVWKRFGGWKNLWSWSPEGQNLAFNFGRQMLAASYCVSAVSKERLSEGVWFLQSESFALAVLKAQQEAIVQQEAISPKAIALANWIGDHQWCGAAMLLSGWLLEATAPLMLLNRRIGLLYGVLFWVFHVMNGWFMGLGFTLTRLILTFLFIIPGLVWLVQALRSQHPVQKTAD